MQIFFDRAASFVAALLTCVVCGVPVWGTIAAARYGIMPTWAYVPAGLLAVIGGILTVAFVRKGLAGIAPTRQRRRRTG